MKTLVCIIVYNRFDNLKRWLECWKKCDQTDTELVVIHNRDESIQSKDFFEACMIHHVRYIPRPNKGMDIGSMKDFIDEKIDKLSTYVPPTYDYLLWITDDTIPMSRDFVKQFTSKLTGRVGLTCMEISNKNSPLHVRTTGFCLRKETAQKLIFPEKIETKEDCYRFEHRGGNMTLMKQIEAMGLKCEQIAPLPISPLWDIGNRAKLNRWEEHEAVFSDPVEPKVTVICPIYNNENPAIITSLLNQTYINWELILVHDGPAKNKVHIDDPRVFFRETISHKGNWGHYIRQEELNSIDLEETDYVVITNADNYHTPNYIEAMLKGFKKGIVATYCAEMVHSYLGWKSQPCRLQRGHIDCAGVMVLAGVAKEIGWRDIESHSSDWTYFSDIIKKYGPESFAKVPGALLVHN